jgi:hypothetical protein
VTEDSVRSLWIGWGIAFIMLGLGLIVTGQWIWICSCLLIGIVAVLRGYFPQWFASARPATLTRTDREVRIVNFLHAGDVLRSNAPKLGVAPDSEIRFNRDVDQWISAVNDFLSRSCALGASAYFMAPDKTPSDVDLNLYSDVLAAARLLDWRMKRLREIRDQEERYLS